MGRRDGWLLADGMTRSQTSPASHDVGMSLAMVKSCAHDVVTKRCWRHAVLLLVLAALTTLAGAAHAAITDAELAGLRQQRDAGAQTLRSNLIDAINRLDASDPPKLIAELIFQFGDFRYAEGGSESALPAVEAALELARQTGDASRIASLDALAGQMLLALRRQSPTSARERIERALQMQRAAGNQIELARQLSAYATLLQEADEYAAAMRLSNEAMVIVEGSGQKMNTVTFAVLYGRVELLRSVGDAASALAAAETLLDRAAASGNPEFIGTTQHAVARASRAVGLKSRAAQLLEASHQQAKEYADPLGQFLTALDRVNLAIEQQEFDIARQWIERAMPLRDAIDDPILRGRLDLADARVAARESKPAKAREAYVRARDALAPSAEIWLVAMLREADADVLVAEGKRAEAVDTLRDALNLRVESERQLQRGVLAAQSDLHRLSEREFREKQLEQEARLRETQLEATEQRLLNQRLIVAVVALAALLAGSVAVWQLQRARRFRRRADTDSLTGVLSRSAIEGTAVARFRRARIENRPFAVLLFDVDGLKPVNDRFGHARGDELLQEVALVIARGLRTRDRLGRWGGDEFIVLLDSADLATARNMGERLRQSIVDGLADAGFADGSCSVGLAASVAEDGSFAEMLARADAALYTAKQGGKNRAVVAGD